MQIGQDFNPQPKRRGRPSKANQAAKQLLEIALSYDKIQDYWQEQKNQQQIHEMKQVQADLDMKDIITEYDDDRRPKRRAALEARQATQNMKRSRHQQDDPYNKDDNDYIPQAAELMQDLPHNQYDPLKRDTVNDILEIQFKQEKENISRGLEKYTQKILSEDLKQVMQLPPLNFNFRVPQDTIEDLLVVWEFTQIMSGLIQVPPIPLWRLEAALYPLPNTEDGSDDSQQNINDYNTINSHNQVLDAEQVLQDNDKQLNDDEIKQLKEKSQKQQKWASKIQKEVNEFQLAGLPIDIRGQSSGIVLRDIHLGLLAAATGQLPAQIQDIPLEAAPSHWIGQNIKITQSTFNNSSIHQSSAYLELNGNPQQNDKQQIYNQYTWANRVAVYLSSLPDTLVDFECKEAATQLLTVEYENLTCRQKLNILLGLVECTLQQEKLRDVFQMLADYENSVGELDQERYLLQIENMSQQQEVIQSPQNNQPQLVQQNIPSPNNENQQKEDEMDTDKPVQNINNTKINANSDQKYKSDDQQVNDNQQENSVQELDMEWDQTNKRRHSNQRQSLDYNQDWSQDQDQEFDQGQEKDDDNYQPQQESDKDSEFEVKIQRRQSTNTRSKRGRKKGSGKNSGWSKQVQQDYDQGQIVDVDRAKPQYQEPKPQENWFAWIEQCLGGLRRYIGQDSMNRTYWAFGYLAGEGIVFVKDQNEKIWGYYNQEGLDSLVQWLETSYDYNDRKLLYYLQFRPARAQKTEQDQTQTRGKGKKSNKNQDEEAVIYDGYIQIFGPQLVGQGYLKAQDQQQQGFYNSKQSYYVFTEDEKSFVEGQVYQYFQDILGNVQFWYYFKQTTKLGMHKIAKMLERVKHALSVEDLSKVILELEQLLVDEGTCLEPLWLSKYRTPWIQMIKNTTQFQQIIMALVTLQDFIKVDQDKLTRVQFQEVVNYSRCPNWFPWPDEKAVILKSGLQIQIDKFLGMLFPKDTQIKPQIESIKAEDQSQIIDKHQQIDVKKQDNKQDQYKQDNTQIVTSQDFQDNQNKEDAFKQEENDQDQTQQKLKQENIDKLDKCDNGNIKVQYQKHINELENQDIIKKQQEQLNINISSNIKQENNQAEQLQLGFSDNNNDKNALNDIPYDINSQERKQQQQNHQHHDKLNPPTILQQQLSNSQNNQQVRIEKQDQGQTYKKEEQQQAQNEFQNDQNFSSSSLLNQQQNQENRDQNSKHTVQQQNITKQNDVKHDQHQGPQNQINRTSSIKDLEVQNQDIQSHTQSDLAKPQLQIDPDSLPYDPVKLQQNQNKDRFRNSDWLQAILKLRDMLKDMPLVQGVKIHMVAYRYAEVIRYLDKKHQGYESVGRPSKSQKEKKQKLQSQNQILQDNIQHENQEYELQTLQPHVTYWDHPHQIPHCWLLVSKIPQYHVNNNFQEKRKIIGDGQNNANNLKKDILDSQKNNLNQQATENGNLNKQNSRLDTKVPYTDMFNQTALDPRSNSQIQALNPNYNYQDGNQSYNQNTQHSIHDLPNTNYLNSQSDLNDIYNPQYNYGQQFSNNGQLQQYANGWNHQGGIQNYNGLNNLGQNLNMNQALQQMQVQQMLYGMQGNYQPQLQQGMFNDYHNQYQNQLNQSTQYNNYGMYSQNQADKQMYFQNQIRQMQIKKYLQQMEFLKSQQKISQQQEIPQIQQYPSQQQYQQGLQQQPQNNQQQHPTQTQKQTLKNAEHIPQQQEKNNFNGVNTQLQRVDQSVQQKSQSNTIDQSNKSKPAISQTTEFNQNRSQHESQNCNNSEQLAVESQVQQRKSRKSKPEIQKETQESIKARIPSYLAIPLHIDNTITDFIVRPEQFFRGLRKDWQKGDRFRMYFGGKASVKSGKVWSHGSYYKGSIVDIERKQNIEGYDPWECLKVKWDDDIYGDSFQDHVSPWEIEVDPDEEKKKEKLLTRKEQANARRSRAQRADEQQKLIQQIEQNTQDMDGNQQNMSNYWLKQLAPTKEYQQKIDRERAEQANQEKGAVNFLEQVIQPGDTEKQKALTNLYKNFYTNWMLATVNENDQNKIPNMNIPQNLLNTLPDCNDFFNMVTNFMRTRKNQPKFKIPIFGGGSLNVLKLFVVVQERGGYLTICENKLWREVTRLLDVELSGQTAASYQLRSNYEKCLYDFELYMTSGEYLDDLKSDNLPSMDPIKDEK